MKSPNRSRLSAHVTYTLGGRTVQILGDCLLRIEDCPSDIGTVMRILEKGADNAELVAESSDPFFYEQFLGLLKRTRFLTEEFGGHETPKVAAAQTFYFEGLTANAPAAALRLQQSHVSILGIGGIGAVVLQHLVGAGIRQYCLIDGDVVRASDMNRQFIYKTSDIGRPKVEAARDYIIERFAGADVVLRNDFARESSDLASWLPQETSLLLHCADFPSCKIDEVVADVSQSRSLPFVSGGCRFEGGTWTLVVPPDRVLEFLAHQKKKAERVATTGHVHGQPSRASYGPLNTIIAAFMASAAIRYIAGFPQRCDGQMWHLDLIQPRISSERIWRNTDGIA